MSIFASRYASALADVVASAHLDPAQVSQQLSDFAGTWQGSRELREVFENPSYPLEKKISILDQISSRIGAAPQVRNFLAVLISHDRIAAFAEIYAAYLTEMDRRLGVSEVTVVSARKLEQGERNKLQEQIARLAGGQVHAQYEEDGALLGGAIVRIGSTVYDGSVRGQLNRLREELVTG